jgi:cell division protein FtsX
MVFNTPISFLVLIMLAMLVVIILVLVNVTVALNQSVENGKKIDITLKEEREQEKHQRLAEENATIEMREQAFAILGNISNEHAIVKGQHEDIKANATAEIAIGLEQHYNMTQAHMDTMDKIQELILAIHNKTSPYP